MTLVLRIIFFLMACSLQVRVSSVGPPRTGSNKLLQYSAKQLS